MDFFDFYKLLNIPVGTTIEDIKKAYILKVHQYSGAFQEGDEKAAEYLNIITKGYELLSDPEKKRVYDMMLLKYYLKQKNSEISRSLYKKFGNSERNPVLGEADEDLTKNIEPPNEIHSVEKLDAAKKGIVQEKLLLVLGFFMVFLLLMLFDHFYWKPYTDITMISNVILAIAYLMTMVWTLKKIYRYFEIRNMILQKKVSAEKYILIVFLTMFFAIPALTIRAENIRRSYHLEHYSKSAIATNFMLEDEWLTVDYVVNGKAYKQSVSMGDNAENFKKNHYDKMKFIIHYSSKNPNIISIETK